MDTLDVLQMHCNEGPHQLHRLRKEGSLFASFYHFLFGLISNDCQHIIIYLILEDTQGSKIFHIRQGSKIFHVRGQHGISWEKLFIVFILSSVTLVAVSFHLFDSHCKGRMVGLAILCDTRKSAPIILLTRVVNSAVWCHWEVNALVLFPSLWSAAYTFEASLTDYLQLHSEQQERGVVHGAKVAPRLWRLANCSSWSNPAHSLLL